MTTEISDVALETVVGGGRWVHLPNHLVEEARAAGKYVYNLGPGVVGSQGRYMWTGKDVYNVWKPSWFDRWRGRKAP